jgi:hypothetical protein
MKDNPMINLKYWTVLIVTMAILVGCQADNAPLPTLVDLNATNEALAIDQTAVAVAQTETALAPTATSAIPTFPPTFTYTPDVLPTDLPPTPDPNSSPTPEGFSKDGTIYYNYNGDSIARVLPDGSLNEIVVTFGIDQPITDLTASPDGRLLAFVAQSAGSAREVWVSNRDGSYLQQVSCLGFGEVRKPTFAPDSNRIAFFAAPLATTEMLLYVADFAGSNDCPNGNNQQQLFPMSTTTTGDIAWNSSGDMIYYNAGGTYVYDFTTQASYIITENAGFGSDTGLSYNVETDQVIYLRTQRNLTTGETGGAIVVIDDADDFRSEYVIQPIDVYALSLKWNADNDSMLFTTRNNIVFVDSRTGNQIPLQSGLSEPLAVFSPNARNYVYTKLDPESNIRQLHIANRLNQRDKRQITFNPEGTIQSILWLEG